MAFAHPSILSPTADRSEQLARLAYELLDANGDTERLVHERPTELEGRAHLSYLRDLQVKLVSGLAGEHPARLVDNGELPVAARPGAETAVSAAVHGLATLLADGIIQLDPQTVKRTTERLIRATLTGPRRGGTPTE